jgi:hypothetical protein
MKCSFPCQESLSLIERLSNFSIDEECPTKLTRSASEGEAAKRDELIVRPRWRFLMLRFS